MNVNLNNVGIGPGAFGVGDQPKVDGQKLDGQNLGNARPDLHISQVKTVDVLRGSEPVAEVPAAELSRDDALGKLVASVYNLPPPPMPAFGD